MAKPRVFISSTYYDLKHVRSSLESFVELLGYEPVLSEKDDIAYLPDVPLDESCYREARNSDIYVLIVGGRYGSPVSAQRVNAIGKSNFYHRYESITRQEHDSAHKRNIPIYILIDSAVDAEYQTWQGNRDNKSVKYAHVDSVNIFYFIESIREKIKNNPVKTFSRYSEIESYLKDQWAGYFRELILKSSTQPQIDDVDQKVTQLMETSETLKNYLEQVVSQVTSEKKVATKIISKENSRLKLAKEEAEFLSNPYMRHLNRQHGFSVERIRHALKSSLTHQQFISSLFPKNLPGCSGNARAFSEVNDARLSLGLPIFDERELEVARNLVENWRKESSGMLVAQRARPKSVSVPRAAGKSTPKKKASAKSATKRTKNP